MNTFGNKNKYYSRLFLLTEWHNTDADVIEKCWKCEHINLKQI